MDTLEAIRTLRLVTEEVETLSIDALGDAVDLINRRLETIPLDARLDEPLLAAVVALNAKLKLRLAADLAKLTRLQAALPKLPEKRPRHKK